MRRMPEMTLQEQYDALLLDLDGTLMHGGDPIPGAADAVRAARSAGLAMRFATNNASRSPEQVVSHLATVDVEATIEEIVTAPQIAAQLLAGRLEPGSGVLVVGGASLADEIRAAGLRPTDRDAPDVAAVVQGWAPEVGWVLLAEGAYAIRRGALWMATNVDSTLPTEKGLAPGNGSLVAALRHATGAEPAVAGKPEPGMFELAARDVDARRPLVVGDRLDTDIEGGVRAGIDTLLVLTGVSGLEEALRADAVRRPTWVLADMVGIARPFARPVLEGDRARCGGASALWRDGDIHLRGDLSDLRGPQAALALIAQRCPESAWTGRLHENSATGER